MSVSVPTSVTDPYAPEPAQTAPVRIRLRRLDDTVTEVAETVRVLTPHLLLRTMGAMFIYRGTTDGARLYREVPVLDLDGSEKARETEGETVAYKKGLAVAVAVAVEAVSFYGDKKYTLRQMTPPGQAIEDKVIRVIDQMTKALP